MPISGGGAAAAAVGGHEYVDRGDPSAWDYTEATLTINGAWHTLDLSSIVTDGDAEVVHLRMSVKDDTVGRHLYVRKNGRSNEYNYALLPVVVANEYNYNTQFVACDGDQVVEYKVTSGVDNARLLVLGWIKPAS